MLGKGECASASPRRLITSAATKQPASFSAVKTSCLFAGRNFQGIFNDRVTETWTIFEWRCTPTVRPLGEAVGLLDAALPSFGAAARSGDG